jgi:hypothetical protein
MHVVTPLDALVVINQLRSPDTVTAAVLATYDVNHDGQLSPLDALAIINYLDNPAAQGAVASPAIAAPANQSASVVQPAASSGALSGEALAFALGTASASSSSTGHKHSVDAVFGNYSPEE